MTVLKALTAPQRARRRMVTVAALAAGAAIALSGCGAGQLSQTSSQVAAVNGNQADVGTIALRNVHIVLPAAGSEYTNAKGGKALIALSLINNSESVGDELTSITTDLGTVKITPAAGKSTVELPPQHTVVAAAKPVKQSTPATSAPATSAPATSAPRSGAPTTPAPATSAPATSAPAGSAAHGAEAAGIDPEAAPIMIEITGLSRDITPGLTYNVAFNFKQSGTVQMQVPVDAGTDTQRHESDKSGGEAGKPAASGGEHTGGH